MLHAVVAAAPIVPALLIAYLVTQHRLPAGRPMIIALAMAFALCAAIAMTLVSRLRLRMLRFVTLIPVRAVGGGRAEIGSDRDRSDAFGAAAGGQKLLSVETHPLPLAVYGVSREMEYGLTFYRNQTTVRYERDSVPAEEHLLVAPATWKMNVAKQTAGRRVLLLGHYAPQDVDYYWVAAAGAADNRPANLRAAWSLLPPLVRAVCLCRANQLHSKFCREICRCVCCGGRCRSPLEIVLGDSGPQTFFLG